MSTTLRSLTLALTFCQSVASFAVKPRANDVYTSSVETIVTSTVVLSPLTIDTAIGTAGVLTLIPNALTITFDKVPAYIYLETSVSATSYITAYETVSVKVNTAKVSQTVSNAAAATTPATVDPISAEQLNALKACFTEGDSRDSMEISRTTTSRDIISCYKDCSAGSDCASFGFDYTANQCAIYSTSANVAVRQTSFFFGTKNNGADRCYSSHYPSSSSSTTAPSPSSSATAKVPAAQYAALNACFVQGTAKSDMPVFHSVSGLSIDSCASECSGTTACQAWSFDYNTAMCTMYEAPIDISSGATAVWFANKAAGGASCYDKALASQTASTSAHVRARAVGAGSV